MKKTAKGIRKTAIYPGTFDPITFGHIDVIERASQLFDSVIVSVAGSSSKKTLFTVEERIEMIKNSVKKFKNVSVSSFKGLLVENAKRQNAGVIIRGLRAVSDFEYEFQMALTNRKIAENVTTVFLMPNERYTYLNSTLVREIAAFGGDVSPFVPEFVKKKLKLKLGKKVSS
jgi:pantetheine-phosphate adenylyltransferase